jgi:hypothetical protein
MTIVAVGTTDIFETFAVRVAFYAVGAVVMVKPGNLAGTVLVEPGLMVADLANV